MPVLPVEGRVLFAQLHGLVENGRWDVRKKICHAKHGAVTLRGVRQTSLEFQCQYLGISLHSFRGMHLLGHLKRALLERSWEHGQQLAHAPHALIDGCSRVDAGTETCARVHDGSLVLVKVDRLQALLGR